MWLVDGVHNCGCFWTHHISTLSPYFFHQFIPTFSFIFSKKILCLALWVAYLWFLTLQERQICWQADSWRLEVKSTVKNALPVAKAPVTRSRGTWIVYQPVPNLRYLLLQLMSCITLSTCITNLLMLQWKAVAIPPNGKLIYPKQSIRLRMSLLLPHQWPSAIFLSCLSHNQWWGLLYLKPTTLALLHVATDPPVI